MKIKSWLVVLSVVVNLGASDVDSGVVIPEGDLNTYASLGITYSEETKTFVVAPELDTQLITEPDALKELLSAFNVYSLGGDKLLPLGRPYDDGSFSLFRSGRKAARPLSEHLHWVCVGCNTFLAVFGFQMLLGERCPDIWLTIGEEIIWAPPFKDARLDLCSPELLKTCPHKTYISSTMINISCEDVHDYYSVVTLFSRSNGWDAFSVLFGLTEKSIELLKVLYKYRQKAKVVAVSGGGVGVPEH